MSIKLSQADQGTKRSLNPQKSFQDLILTLQIYWAEYGCVILQPYDMEVGAGTFHPATILRALGPKPWNAAYVQPSRRPSDGRYGENPNRLQHYYQFQVILKPSPDDMQELYLKSLYAIGIDAENHDIRFVDFPIVNNIDISEDSILIVSWKPKPICFYINSKDVTEKMRQYFYSVWKIAKK